MSILMPVLRLPGAVPTLRNATCGLRSGSSQLARSRTRTQTRSWIISARGIQNSSGTSSQESAEAFLEEAKPGITFLQLNRPKAKNAISLRLLKEFRECLDTVHFNKNTRVLIIRSTTVGSFCAGADLAERRTMSQLQVDKFLLDLRAALGKLENLPMPTVAAIDGPALGGGLELGLACDLRVAGHSVTKIGLPETKLGIIPGAGGTQRLTRLLGLAKAKNLIFTGRSLTASEALEYGVVDYVSDPDKSAVDKALELAEEIAANGEAIPVSISSMLLRTIAHTFNHSTPGIESCKQAISRAPELALEPGLSLSPLVTPTSERVGPI
ncbi:hypothetical protein NLI96_g2572 [Meripilus lineatus]|uniref:ClpP/crotonase n=1 Tax=Meripilus lineatus TaxID=2056292 RepID=A0AAD5V8I3_9APHY|nr:hypothetical protein NLI96_g2572 [Physisporinus lineatus]